MGPMVINTLGGDARGKTVALLGLTLKPNTDDMRDAPSLAVVQILLDAGAIVRAHDPECMDHARQLLLDVIYCRDANDTARDADAVTIVADWNIYRARDLKRLAAAVDGNVMVDLRNVYPPADATKLALPIARSAGDRRFIIDLGAVWTGFAARRPGPIMDAW